MVKKDKSILALDLSTHSTGWCTEYSGKKEYGCITSSSSKVEQRIVLMRDEILKLIKKYGITDIILEEVRPDTPNNHTNKVLTWLQGAIYIMVYEYNKAINIDTMQASEWRSKIGIKTGRGVTRQSLKLKDIEYVQTHYGIKVNDDIADAIGLYDAYNQAPPHTIDGFEFK